MAPDVSILVVDDDPPLLRLMQAFLERLGYRVEGVLTAVDALARFQAEPDRFKVVVADLSLPDMPGEELGKTLVRLNPAVRILLCSGYPFEVDSLPADIRRGFAHLQKPFLPAMLAKIVAELVDRD